MLTMCQIGWIAGFLEGEAYFGGTAKHRSIQVNASQVEREPLEKLERWLGGTITQVPARVTGHIRAQAIWKWYLGSNRAVQLMMTIYPLMSPKRQGQITRTLRIWKTMPFRHPHHCRNGHPWEGNTYLACKRYRRCRPCTQAADKRAYARARKLATKLGITVIQARGQLRKHGDYLEARPQGGQ